MQTDLALNTFACRPNTVLDDMSVTDSRSAKSDSTWLAIPPAVNVRFCSLALVLALAPAVLRWSGRESYHSSSLRSNLSTSWKSPPLILPTRDELAFSGS